MLCSSWGVGCDLIIIIRTRPKTPSEVVKEFFANLGYGEISDEDAKIILETADGDKDGRIGLEDFRMMVRTHGMGSETRLETRPVIQ